MLIHYIHIFPNVCQMHNIWRTVEKLQWHPYCRSQIILCTSEVKHARRTLNKILYDTHKREIEMIADGYVFYFIKRDTNLLYSLLWQFFLPNKGYMYLYLYSSPYIIRDIKSRRMWNAWKTPYYYLYFYIQQIMHIFQCCITVQNIWTSISMKKLWC
jgi:hypothetical protein